MGRRDKTYQELPYDFTESDIDEHINETYRMTGEKIDRKAFRKYLKEEKYRDEFDHREYHVAFMCGAIVSGHHIIEKRGSDPQRYDKIMDLAALAIETYNKEHQTKFKVVEIEKLNRQGCRVQTYHMTFSAVDLKGTETEQKTGDIQQSNLTQLHCTSKGIMSEVLVLLAWLFGCRTTWLNLNKSKQRSVPDLKASKHEIDDDTLTRKTFQASVIEGWINGWTHNEPEVRLCRATEVQL